MPDTCRLICVVPDQVEAFWPHVEGLIAQACARSLYDLAGCRRSLREGRALLWIVWDDENGAIVAALTTELHRINGRLLCFIAALGGRERGRWLHLIAGIEAFARAEGCAAVIVMGRRGWARALSGYRPRGIILEQGI
jgi:hypothetical protein